jgi:nitric oxide reductase subunit B
MTDIPKKTTLRKVMIITIICSFSVLLLGGFYIFKSMAPRPSQVVDVAGHTLFTKDQIIGGQAVYEKYGLMDYGSVLGHGSYLGPDYTAESLHVYLNAMHEYYAKQKFNKSYNQLTTGQKADINSTVIQEIRQNRYDDTTKTLTLTKAQTVGYHKVVDYYVKEFTSDKEMDGLPIHFIKDTKMKDGEVAYVGNGPQLNQMADFFFWSAWLSSTNRPGETHTYTNNWPYDAMAGNTLSYAAVVWTAVSIALLVLAIGIILYYYKRYNLEMEEAYTEFPTLKVGNFDVTPSQRKTAKYFLVVVLLFLVQSAFGGLLAHYYADGNSFFGLNLVSIFPFNIVKGWHLQLAIFWIATAWLAMGIYIAPLASGKEPKRQGLLVDILFWALIVLVAGSMIGEWFGAKDMLGNFWWLLGHFGWEYIELGKIWQVILVIGMLIWLFIVTRGIASALKKEKLQKEKGGLIHMLFYSSIAIPLFYFAAFFINPDSHITYADYWRWWIVHLWVEGIFEVFAVILIGFLMVSMKLVTKKSTERALMFQIIILLGSGVIGTGHHYYWQGTPEAWLGLGAVFSAVEVVPLTLLILEAYSQHKWMKEGGKEFPYSGAFLFLISTAIWNLLGAGVLGFLLNTPVVSYFEHGSNITAAHAHGAMMGVYGMFSIAIILYAMRNIVKPEVWEAKKFDKLIKIACWLLNIGLAGMIIITLLPVGFMQLSTAYTEGFWAARQLSFYHGSVVHFLLWIRMVPDTIFILGILPLVWLLWIGIRNLRAVTKKS